MPLRDAMPVYPTSVNGSGRTGQSVKDAKLRQLIIQSLGALDNARDAGQMHLEGAYYVVHGNLWAMMEALSD